MKTAKTLSRTELLETMRFLGWETHDEAGNVLDEAYHVAARLVEREAVESVMLPSWIAQEVDAYRAAKP